jgi:hypothetical protein
VWTATVTLTVLHLVKMPFSWLVERVSRSFINKRLLRDFLMEELEEWQTRVVSSERALYLLDLKLRADSLNVLLDGVCGVRIVSASIDKLVIKFPSLTDIQRQSGLLEVSANVINLELDTVMEATEADGVAHIGAEQLAASLSALRQSARRYRIPPSPASSPWHPSAPASCAPDQVWLLAAWVRSLPAIMGAPASAPPPPAHPRQYHPA